MAKLEDIFKSPKYWVPGSQVVASLDAPIMNESPKKEEKLEGLVQWSTSDNKRFIGTANTRSALIPGLYDIQASQSIGVYFSQVQVKTEGLIRFPHTDSDKILDEISRFWDRGEIFSKYGLTHKRGILFYGPPGGGKSSCIALLLEDIINRGGVAIRFTSPDIFIMGMRILREIQPQTPVIVIMEDLDSILEYCSESIVLNILDGVENVNKTVFLASTNYPEKLGARIINRPSRFDKRVRIGNPTPESRLVYLNNLIKDANFEGFEPSLDQWIKDTEGFSFAHIRELFIAVVILGNSYQISFKLLKDMNQKLSSDRDYQSRKSGFNENTIISSSD